MRELVLFLAKSLVDQPDAVQVMETEGPEAIILELSVHGLHRKASRLGAGGHLCR